MAIRPPPTLAEFRAEGARVATCYFPSEVWGRKPKIFRRSASSFWKYGQVRESCTWSREPRSRNPCSFNTLPRKLLAHAVYDAAQIVVHAQLRVRRAIKERRNQHLINLGAGRRPHQILTLIIESVTEGWSLIIIGGVVKHIEVQRQLAVRVLQFGQEPINEPLFYLQQFTHRNRVPSSSRTAIMWTDSPGRNPRANVPRSTSSLRRNARSRDRSDLGIRPRSRTPASVPSRSRDARPRSRANDAAGLLAERIAISPVGNYTDVFSRYQASERRRPSGKSTTGS
jgi:hypothetical protein